MRARPRRRPLPRRGTPPARARPCPLPPYSSRPARVRLLPARPLAGQTAPGQTVPGQTAPDLAAPGYGPVPGYGPRAGHGPGFAAPRGYGQPPPRQGSQLLPPGSRTRALTAAGLLAAGVVLGIVGLFTSYLGSSIASKPDELVPHAIYLAAWTASALLIAAGPARQRIGALLGLGTSVVTFGLLAADLATALSAHSPAGGMWPTLLGWLLATAGAAAGYHRAAAGAPAKLRARETGPLLMLLLAGLGTAAAFAPSWDKFTITASNGASRTITAGNAFANPGLVIAGDVLVMAALVAVVVVAALWRPARLGAALLAGATIPMAAQAISALVQLGEASPAQQVGLSPSQASAAGLTVTAGPTPVFWVYCIFVGALIACCAWLLLAPAQDPARPAPAWPVPPGRAPGATRPAADDRTPAMAGAPARQRYRHGRRSHRGRRAGHGRYPGHSRRPGHGQRTHSGRRPGPGSGQQRNSHRRLVCRQHPAGRSHVTDRSLHLAGPSHLASCRHHGSPGDLSDLTGPSHSVGPVRLAPPGVRPQFRRRSIR